MCRVRELSTIIQVWPQGQIHMEASEVHFVNFVRIFCLGQLQLCHRSQPNISKSVWSPPGCRGVINLSTEQTPMVDKRDEVFLKVLTIVT
jgi:hypothetical protein